MKTIAETKTALQTLAQFMGYSQTRVAAGYAMRGEEHQFYRETLCRLAGIVDTMASTYDQRDKGEDSIIYLHYFMGGCDWHILEKDKGTDEEKDQVQAFGWCDLGYGAELGYVSLVEILAAGAELDFHFEPMTVRDWKAKRNAPPPKNWEKKRALNQLMEALRRV